MSPLYHRKRCHAGSFGLLILKGEFALPCISKAELFIYSVEDSALVETPWWTYEYGTRGITGEPVDSYIGRYYFQALYHEIDIFIYRRKRQVIGVSAGQRRAFHYIEQMKLHPKKAGLL